MFSGQLEWKRSLAAIYAGTAADVSFDEILQRHDAPDDDALAELIEHDGRLRISHNREITLQRYFGAVPDLLHRRDPLDAAIDVSLRWMSQSPRADSDAVDALVNAYPHLEDEIRDAAALNNAMWSTELLREQVGGKQRELPQEFGPLLEDGQLRYELRTMLGDGSFGEVYQAVDRHLSEEDHQALVAVKIFADRNNSSRQAGQRLLGRPRLVEEATKARRIDHPNVVRVLDRGIAASDEAYIVYELIQGGDLDKWMHEQVEPVSIRKAAWLAAKIARGVQAAHAAGLVHCDLKPGNVILTSEGKPKVADFGIAVRYGQAQPLQYARNDGASDHPIGNLAFISPEQYRMDEGALSVPSDIYAIGGILYTLLTGNLPNGDSIKEIAEVHHPKRGRAMPPSPRNARPDVDQDLDAICRRAMAIEPGDRYTSAGALANDLEAWLHYEPLYWNAPSPLRVLNLWRKRKPAMAIASLLLLGSITLGLLAANHYARSAADARVEAAYAQAAAEVAQYREQELSDRNEAAKLYLTAFQNRLNEMRQQGATSSQLLPITWSLQFMLEEDSLGGGSASDQIQNIQIDTVRNLLKNNAEAGRDDDLESLLWQSTLAFWLIGSGELDDAQRLLDTVEPRWEDILEPRDRWLEHLRAMRAALEVQQVEQAAEDSTLNARHRQKLAAAEGTLLREHELLLDSDPKSPLHLLVLESLIRLYGPTLLDQAEAHGEAGQLLARYGGRRYNPSSEDS